MNKVEENDWLSKGCVSFNLGNYTLAEKYYKKALIEEPNNPEILFILSGLLVQRKNYKRGKYLIEKALKLSPKNKTYFNSLLVILRVTGALQKEKETLEMLLKRNITVKLLMKYGEVLRLLKDDNAAIQAFEKVLKFEKTNCFALANIGDIYSYQMQLKNAKKYYKLAICANPNFAQVRDILGKLYLKQGKYKEGWEGYEWRLQYGCSNLKDVKNKWDGKSQINSSIMIICEQGFGDVLHFARFIPIIKTMFKTIKFFCQKSLIPLFEIAFPYCEFIEKNEQLPLDFDYHIPIMSLGQIFNICENTIPNQKSYLIVEKNKQKDFSKEIVKNKINIGFCWAGNLKNKNLSYRAIPLDDFALLFKYSHINFFSLRKDKTENYIAKYANSLDNVFDLTDEFDDFYDTAAFIMNLDLIITVDTAIAHLAGALGKKTILLLSYQSDWRWLLDRADSPWYSSITIIRQKNIDDWSSVIEQVNNLLYKEFNK